MELLPSDKFENLVLDGKFEEAKKIELDNYQHLFIWSCVYGYLKVSKWLLSIKDNNIDINAKNDYAFRYSCYYGNINIAKWLLSIKDNNININAENDFAFRSSCEYGHIKIYQWLLLMLKINLDLVVFMDV